MKGAACGIGTRVMKAERAGVLGWATRWRAVCVQEEKKGHAVRASASVRGRPLSGPVRQARPRVVAGRCGEKREGRKRCWAASGPVRVGKKRKRLGLNQELGQNGRR